MNSLIRHLSLTIGLNFSLLKRKMIRKWGYVRPYSRKKVRAALRATRASSLRSPEPLRVSALPGNARAHGGGA